MSEKIALRAAFFAPALPVQENASVGCRLLDGHKEAEEFIELRAWLP
jgi:hypothetical protein